MLNSKFFTVDCTEVDVEDRKYVQGEAGIAECCDTFCMAKGRGHVHVIKCQPDKCSSDLHDGHRHAQVLIPAAIRKCWATSCMYNYVHF